MSKTENAQQGPVVDFGFHIVIPRIVRTGYKDISLTQKWLYACLKDLCGDHGTCYRALRTLSEETGFSTGMLSESIQVLHQQGLIHAEKKRRSSGGKEVWHITITDIWKENAKIHPTKRSQNEQTQKASTENVHNVNDNPIVCSQNEQECSQCETEVIPLSNNNTEVITRDTSDGSIERITPLTLSQEEINLILSLRNPLQSGEYSAVSGGANLSLDGGTMTPPHVESSTSHPIATPVQIATENNASTPTSEIACNDMVLIGFSSQEEIEAPTVPKVGKVKKPAKPEPTPEEIAMNERCRGWQLRLNEWRGYELELQGAIINERKCIRKLCEKYTDAQIKQIYTYLFKQDWKWSKADNRFRIGACEMLTESGRILQQLSGTVAPALEETTKQQLPNHVGQYKRFEFAPRRKKEVVS